MSVHNSVSVSRPNVESFWETMPESVLPTVLQGLDFMSLKALSCPKLQVQAIRHVKEESRAYIQSVQKLANNRLQGELEGKLTELEKIDSFEVLEKFFQVFGNAFFYGFKDLAKTHDLPQSKFLNFSLLLQLDKIDKNLNLKAYLEEFQRIIGNTPYTPLLACMGDRIRQNFLRAMNVPSSSPEDSYANDILLDAEVSDLTKGTIGKLVELCTKAGYSQLLIDGIEHPEDNDRSKYGQVCLLTKLTKALTFHASAKDANQFIGKIHNESLKKCVVTVVLRENKNCPVFLRNFKAHCTDNVVAGEIKKFERARSFTRLWDFTKTLLAVTALVAAVTAIVFAILTFGPGTTFLLCLFAVIAVSGGAMGIGLAERGPLIFL